ncbi:hem oxygenase-like, multi-helical [Purpureocillium lavendulum]|uniref:Hem oxygenase-like, multi-helical n=1 Tax=Purpureocillium lavendulum TaxID=1247861 RepID=A0AB34FH72_9HYPO|nr:hem oxygenase-like, multi-helical [Purpureocillium lavendulum]
MAAIPLDSFRADRPLAESIALATRAIHARLNKLIVSRLPLALPPRAADPAAFLTGLLHIAPIYETFEEEWQAIIDAPTPTTPSPPCPSASASASTSKDSLPDACDRDAPHFDSGSHPLPQDDGPRLHKPLVCDRMHSMLRHLYLPGLVRSERLRADIRAMTAWPDHVVEEQLQAVGGMGYLAEFLQHIRRAVMNKPHVLVAYSYIMFMALFAGGRFIRASLESAGEPFWAVEPSPARPTMRTSERRRKMAAKERRPHDLEDDDTMPGGNPDAGRPQQNMPLHFFHFDTPMDGEDLKREFKQRLVDSEALLTPREKRDIVQEAVCIFENVTLVVLQLDALFPDNHDAPQRATPRRQSSLHSLAMLLKSPLANRFRDSVAVTKQRKERSSSKRSSGHEESNCPIANPKLSADTSSAASLDGTVVPPSLPDGHVPTANFTGIELCPAFAKSVRFEKAPDMLVRSREMSADDSQPDVAEALKMVSRRLAESRMTQWVVVAAFGVIFLGAMLAGQRVIRVEMRSV